MSMKFLPFISILFFLFSCSPKRPQTFASPLVGKTKNQLIAEKGVAKTIRVYKDSEIYIYTIREAYYGNKNPETDKSIQPKKVLDIEHIYYINADDIVYKYQVWEKKVKDPKK